LEFENRAEQDHEQYAKDISTFERNESLLLRHFSKEQRLKNAFLLKISFDKMYADEAIFSESDNQDIAEKEKYDIFFYNDLELKKSLGLKEYLDVEKRLLLR
jgi:hypothetical protein